MITIGKLMSASYGETVSFKVAVELENMNVKPSLETEGIRTFLCGGEHVAAKLSGIKSSNIVAVLWTFNKEGNETANDLCALDKKEGWQ